MIIKAKSKTFLVGEYCVMCGGSAIILCTNPDFRLRVKRNSYSILRGFPKQSPAFYFYQENRKIFDGLFIKFIDPHKKSGGFGASSAQFVLLYKLRNFLIGANKNNHTNTNIKSKINNEINIDDFLKEYRKIAGKEFEIPPSGADCVSQIFYNKYNRANNTNIVYFDSSVNQCENLVWNFDDIDFLVIKTDNKVATHSHLKQLSADFLLQNRDRLDKIVKLAKESFQTKQSEVFIKCIADFQNILNEIGLVANETKVILEDLLKVQGVLAAKGCGALGADTISIFFKKESKNTILNVIKKNQKKIYF